VNFRARSRVERAHRRRREHDAARAARACVVVARRRLGRDRAGRFAGRRLGVSLALHDFGANPGDWPLRATAFSALPADWSDE